MNQLVLDAGFELDGVSITHKPNEDFEGRFGFVLSCNEEVVYILMPGIDISKVRYIGKESQNILKFPRLYIDDGSFLWLYVVGILKRQLKRSSNGC